MMYSTSIGLDVHAHSIKAAALVHETGVLIEKSFGYDALTLCEWIKSLEQPVRCIYESGPTGFDLLRKLQAQDIVCSVGAVSKMLRPAGDKIKNDKRDAVFLARMLAMGNTIDVYVPTPEEEAARDLCRAREDLRQDLTRAKHHLLKFLLRKGIIYEQGCAWTKTHKRWLEHLKFSYPDEQMVFEEYLIAIGDLERKRERLDTVIKQRAQDLPWCESISRFTCLRGISTITAFALCVEIGDFGRFKNASAFASYLGLVPSLNESGGSSSRGRITRTGNTHVRKLLIEAAWHHRRQYRAITLSEQITCLPPAIAGKVTDANRRLHRRAVYLTERKLPACKANVAIARELAGWIWSLACMQVS